MSARAQCHCCMSCKVGMWHNVLNVYYITLVCTVLPLNLNLKEQFHPFVLILLCWISCACREQDRKGWFWPSVHAFWAAPHQARAPSKTTHYLINRYRSLATVRRSCSALLQMFGILQSPPCTLYMNLASGSALLATTTLALILKANRGAQAFLCIWHLFVLLMKQHGKQWAAPPCSTPWLL